MSAITIPEPIPFPCPVCGVGHSTLAAKKAHVKKAHPKKKGKR